MIKRVTTNQRERAAERYVRPAESTAYAWYEALVEITVCRLRLGLERRETSSPKARERYGRYFPAEVAVREVVHAARCARRRAPRVVKVSFTGRRVAVRTYGQR